MKKNEFILPPNKHICLLLVRVFFHSYCLQPALMTTNKEAVTRQPVWDSPQRGSIATDETVDQPAAILGTIPSNLNEALSKRFTNLNDVVDANTTVLIVQGSALSTFAEEISTVYDNNGIAWINETMNISVSTTPGNAETNIEKLINAQTITHTYSYDLKINEAHVIFSKPDDISGKGTFTAKYSIYPLYAFQGQQNSGDYYLVNAEYTAHNKDMCPVENINHMWSVKHGGVKTQLCGFYLTRYGVETILCSDINTHAPIGEFPPTCSPVPQTTHSQPATHQD